MSDCGSPAESCCKNLPVQGGTYNRTYVNNGSGPMNELNPATVSSFRLDKYVVTVGRFRQFVAAWNNGAGYTPPAMSGKHKHLNSGNGLTTNPGFEPGWITSDNANVAPTDANLLCNASYETWTTTASFYEKLPMNCVSWWEAYAFCIWDGGFLPSEAEIEYAGAGGAEERQYPWGTADPGFGYSYANWNCFYGGTQPCTDISDIAPVDVGALGDGKWGQRQLAGNLYEWTLDVYHPYFPCTDCVDLAAGTDRAIRTGFFNYNDRSFLMPSVRTHVPLAFRDLELGIRCARTP